MTKFTETIAQLRRAGQPFVLVSITDGSGSMPRHTGAYMLVQEDGSTLGTVGGGVLEARAIRQAMQVFAQRADQDLAFSLTNEQAADAEMICGGSSTLHFAYDAPGHRAPDIPEQSGMLYIFGGGHVGLALARAAQLVDLPVTVLDDRAAYTDRAHAAGAEAVLLTGFDRIPALEVGPHDLIAIVTRGHLGDADVLRWAVEQDAGYIGMIGSRRKCQMLYDRLTAQGVPKSALEQVHAPIGLAIDAETPGEIAISILAEMIQVRAGWKEEKTQ